MATEKRLYLLAITLPEDLNVKIHLIKQEIARDFQSKYALRLPAHITLQKPFHFTGETSLIKNLQAFKTNLPQFELKLSGYGAFFPRVIYISLEKNAYLEDLYQHLRKWLMNELKFNHQMVSDASFIPHITVAYRDLTKSNFRAAWERFKSRHFNAGFKVYAIDLWRHDGKHWGIIHKFSPFKV